MGRIPPKKTDAREKRGKEANLRRNQARFNQQWRETEKFCLERDLDPKQWAKVFRQPDGPKHFLDVFKLPRAKKGSKGISSYGARIVRNGCYILTQTFGKNRLGLITPTLPNIPEYLPYWVDAWDELMRQLLQEVQRELQRKGGPIHYVGVDELHPNRSRNQGYGIPHSHILIVAWDGKSYKSDGKRQYYISADKLRVIWYRILINYVRKLDLFDSSIPMPKARIEIASIKKSAEAYLGKYLSKGANTVKEFVKDGLPIEITARHWWHCSKDLKKVIKDSVGSIPVEIMRKILGGIDLVSEGIAYYIKPIKRVINSLSRNHSDPLNPIEDKGEMTVGYVFKMTEQWRKPLENELIQTLNSC